jgi:hypothetical protein
MDLSHTSRNSISIDEENPIVNHPITLKLCSSSSEEFDRSKGDFDNHLRRVKLFLKDTDIVPRVRIHHFVQKTCQGRARVLNGGLSRSSNKLPNLKLSIAV